MLGLPPAFVLSQDQTLKFDLGLTEIVMRNYLVIFRTNLALFSAVPDHWSGTSRTVISFVCRHRSGGKVCVLTGQPNWHIFYQFCIPITRVIEMAAACASFHLPKNNLFKIRGVIRINPTKSNQTESHQTGSAVATD